MIEQFHEIEALPDIVWGNLSTVAKLTEHPKIDIGVRFPIAEGLHWFGAHYHGGQSSELYSVLSCLNYVPSHFDNGPSTEESQWVYDTLREYYL